MGMWSTIKFYSDSQAAPIGTSSSPPSGSVAGQRRQHHRNHGAFDRRDYGVARVDPWDCDGNPEWVSRAPDSIFGGRNILSNAGFEDSPCRTEINTVTLDPTVSGGTSPCPTGRTPPRR